MAGLGYALVGAMGGVGDAIVAQAEERREMALLQLKRQWQKEDVQTQRGFEVEDRDLGHERRTEERMQERGWQLEDREAGYEREDYTYDRGREDQLEDYRRERRHELADEAREQGREDARTRRSARALTGTGGAFDELIDRYEGGGDYDTLWGHGQREDGPFAGVRVTDMTIGEALQFADTRGPYAQHVKATNPEGALATPMGRYQIVGSTLRQAVEDLDIPLDTKFTPEVQDVIARHLAQQRIAGPRSQKGKRDQLRKEWAGFKNASDAELDAAIAELEGQGGPVDHDLALTAVDAEHADVRKIAQERAGLGAGKDGRKVVRSYWADEDGDGQRERVREYDDGSTEVVLNDDGEPIRYAGTGNDADIELKASTWRRIQDVLKPNPHVDADPNDVRLVVDEILRLMEEEGLSESQAEAKARRGMVYEEVTAEDQSWMPWSGTPGQFLSPNVETRTQNREGRGRFAGRFEYDDTPRAPRGGLGTGRTVPAAAPAAAPPRPGQAAAATPAPAPTEAPPPIPDDPAALEPGKTYTGPNGLILRWDGEFFEEVA